MYINIRMCIYIYILHTYVYVSYTLVYGGLWTINQLITWLGYLESMFRLAGPCFLYPDKFNLKNLVRYHLKVIFWDLQYFEVCLMPSKFPPEKS